MHYLRQRLFDCPLFLTERVPQAKPNTIAIKESTTDGLGMFATRDIPYGELLLAECPLLVNSVLSESYFYAVDGYTLEDHLKRISIEEEQRLEQALRRMDEDKKDAYMALANSIKGDGPLSNIQQTNGFGIDLNELMDGGMAPDPEELSRDTKVGVDAAGTEHVLHHCQKRVEDESQVVTCAYSCLQILTSHTAASQMPNSSSPWARSPSNSTHCVISRLERRYSSPTPTCMFPLPSVVSNSRGTVSPASAPCARAPRPSRTSSAKLRPPK